MEHSPRPRFAAPRYEAVGALLGVLGTGGAWPPLATDSEKPVHSTNPFCGCEQPLKWVRLEPHASGFCTHSSPSANASCKCASCTVNCVAYLPRTAGLWWSCAPQGKAEEAPGAAFVPSVWREFLRTFLLCRSLGLWFCSKSPVRRREACGGESLFSLFLFLSFFSSCRMFTFTVAWDFFALVEGIERLYPLCKDFLGYPFVLVLG